MELIMNPKLRHLSSIVSQHVAENAFLHRENSGVSRNGSLIHQVNVRLSYNLVAFRENVTKCSTEKPVSRSNPVNKLLHVFDRRYSEWHKYLTTLIFKSLHGLQSSHGRQYSPACAICVVNDTHSNSLLRELQHWNIHRHSQATNCSPKIECRLISILATLV